jgi:hypothetical protein
MDNSGQSRRWGSFADWYACRVLIGLVWTGAIIWDGANPLWLVPSVLLVVVSAYATLRRLDVGFSVRGAAWIAIDISVLALCVALALAFGHGVGYWLAFLIGVLGAPSLATHLTGARNV